MTSLLEGELNELKAKLDELQNQLEGVMVSQAEQAEVVTGAVLKGAGVDKETERLWKLEQKRSAIENALKVLQAQVQLKAQELNQARKEQAQVQLNALVEEGEQAFTYVLDCVYNLSGALAEFQKVVNKQHRITSEYNLPGVLKHYTFIQPFNNKLSEMVNLVKGTNSAYMLEGRPTLQEYSAGVIKQSELPTAEIYNPHFSWLPAPRSYKG